MIWQLLGAFFLMILIHELGHLITSKLFGVKVNVYSLGFGKRICGFKIGDTDYRLSWIPFGGYCALEGEILGTGKPNELCNKRWLIKLIIALAGVTMNILTAFAAMTYIFIKHGKPIMEGLYKFSQMGWEATKIIFQMICTLKIPTLDQWVGNIPTTLNFENYLFIFAILSFVTGLLNLVPFPSLDGSLPILFGLEKVFGKRWGPVIMALLVKYGFMFLMFWQFLLLYVMVR